MRDSNISLEDYKKATKIGLFALFIFVIALLSGCGKILDIASEGQVSTAPIISKGTVYYGSWKGDLYARDAKSGKIKWKKKMSDIQTDSSIADETINSLSTPTVFDDKLFLTIAVDSSLNVIDAKTGTNLWNKELMMSEEADSEAGSSPSVSNGTIYVASSGLLAMDTENGNKKWKFAESIPDTSTALVNGTLYFASKGKIFAVNSKTGKKIWDNDLNGNFSLFKPTSGDNLVFFGIGKGDIQKEIDSKMTARLFAVDSKTGKKKWDKKIGDFASPPVYVNGLLYYGDSNPYFNAVNAQTGELEWRFKLSKHSDGSEGVQSKPLVIGGIVYFGSWDGNIYGLDAKTGKKRWIYDTGDQVEHDISIVDGIAYYVGHYSSQLYALDMKTKKKKWSTSD